MKISIMLVCVLIVGAALAGPLNLRNDQALREHRAKQSYESSAEYYSAAQFEADVAAAKNFGELQAIMVKKAKSEKAEKDAKKK